MAQLLHKLYVIEDSVLSALANNARFVKEFPFLTSLRSVAKQTCRSCGGRNPNRAAAFQSAKMAIIGLSSAKKLQLKQMLNAEQLRIVYARPDKKIVYHTIS